MPKCFKKNSDRSWGIRLNNFGPNWAKILHLLEKDIFWENWLTQLFSTHYATMSQKKNTGRSCDIRCWNCGPSWTQITHLTLQGTFLKKLTDIFAYFRYPITILQCLTKNHWSGSQNFWTNWPEVIFGRKFTIVPFVNLVCPIILKCSN